MFGRRATRSHFGVRPVLNTIFILREYKMFYSKTKISCFLPNFVILSITLVCLDKRVYVLPPVLHVTMCNIYLL